MSWCVKLCVLVGLVSALSTPGQCQTIRRTTRGSYSSITVIASSISGTLIGISSCIGCCVFCYRASKRHANGVPPSSYTERRVNRARRVYRARQQQNYVIQTQQGGLGQQPTVGQVDSHSDQQNIRYANGP